MNLADAVKKCAIDAFEAAIPSDVVFGEVVGEEPIEIRVGEMVITSDVVSVCEHLLYKECRFSFSGYERTIVVNSGLKKGDGVVLLRKSGGEVYVVVGKI